MTGRPAVAAPAHAPHLVACVAHHGWGHLAQTVPMIGALRARLPGLQVTVRTGLPPALVAARFEAAGQPVPSISADATEFGFVMHDALRIDDDASAARYLALHADSARLLERERDTLRALRADVVLANVGWLPLAAAASLGLPAFGASSLNWADVLEGRGARARGLGAVIDWMRACYAQADALFALEPGMPFDGFERRRRIAPIGRRATPRRAELRAALGAPADAKVMMLAFGGLRLDVDTRGWRLPEGWRAVTLTEGGADSATVRRGESLGWAYIDLLASCDLLVAKPGYGTFAEAGFVARDTLVVPREDWPEAPYLQRWLERHARCAPIGLEALRAGAFDEPLAALCAQPARAPACGDGAAEIAEAVARRLGMPPVLVSSP